MGVRFAAIWLLTASAGLVASAEPVQTSASPAGRPIDSRQAAVEAPLPSASADRAPSGVGLLSKESIAQLVAELDSPDFATRESATQRLSEAGAMAVPLVTKAARNGSLETSIRAVSVLEELYTNLEGQDATVDAAESALEELVRAQNASAADRARAVLARHSDIRQRRAIAAIERLGGRVEFRENRFGGAAAGQTQVSHVIIGRAWKGGDEGLKHIQRMGEVQQLYVIQGADVSQQALQSLQQTIPNLELQRRGAAYLGIKGAWKLQDGKGCQVGGVVAGGAADKAGIRSGDIIVGFGGDPVPDFETLIQLIGNYSPGDKVKVNVVRAGVSGNQPIELQAVMDSWTPP